MSQTTSGWRQKGRGGGSSAAQSKSSLPVIAAPQSIGALVRDAEDAVGEAEKLRAQVFKMQQQSRRRRMEIEHDMSEAIRLDAERLAREREALEAQLADGMRQLHKLEAAAIDHNQVTRERKKHAKAVAAQLRKLREVDAHDSDAANVEAEGHRALKDVHKNLEISRQGIEDDLRQAYNLKERTESEITLRRQALAINEALLRVRYERQMVLPEFDEMPSTIDGAEVLVLGP